MKGFALLNLGEVGWIEKEKPVVGLFDAIVRPIAVAPCTSDIHNVYVTGVVKSNTILGHESLGEIVEVGNQVKDFKPGDRVVIPSITPNWRTLEAQCGHHQHSGGLFGGAQFTVSKDGVFSEYFHVNDADMNLALLPDGIPLETAIMIPDMVTTGFYGAEAANIKFGDTVAVLGVGPVGLMAVAGSKLCGAGKIIAVGNRAISLELAKFYGASDIINYKSGDIAEQVMELTNSKGVDIAIVAGGNPDILETAVKITKPGATISNINFFTHTGSLSIPLIDWGFGMAQKTIKGGLCPGGRVRMERLIDLVKYNRVDPSKLATHILYGFDNIEKAFYLMRDKPKDLIKPIVILD